MAQTHSVDLFGQPIPEPAELPRDKQLTDFQELIGHTVRLVFEGTDCKSQADAVIVTETGCFLAIQADEDSLYPINPFRPLDAVHQYVNTAAMIRDGLMGQEKAAAQKRKDERERVKSLRKDAEEARAQAVQSESTAAWLEAAANEAEAAMAHEGGAT